MRAIGVHRVNIEIAIAHGGEYDLLAVERDRGFGVIAGRGGQLLQVGAVRIRRENVISRIHRPHVALRKIRPRRALRARQMRRSVENLFAVGIEKTAGGASFAGRDHVLVAAVDIHRENLVALHIAMRGLIDQLLAVGGKVGFGILSAEGQLMHVAQMLFLRRGHDRVDSPSARKSSGRPAIRGSNESADGKMRFMMMAASVAKGVPAHIHVLCLRPSRSPSDLSSSLIREQSLNRKIRWNRKSRAAHPANCLLRRVEWSAIRIPMEASMKSFLQRCSSF